MYISWQKNSHKNGVMPLIFKPGRRCPSRVCRLATFGETDAVQQQSLNRWLGQDQAFLAKRLAASFRRLAKMDEVLAPYLAGRRRPMGATRLTQR